MTAAQNARGILLMTLSMLLLTSGDAVVKGLSGRYSPPVLLIVMGLGMAVMFQIIAWRRGLTLIDGRALGGAALVRSLSEIGASALMVTALANIPFTILSMVMQATPVFVTLGAVVFFGEKVGWRRWTAILTGFAGVVIILRPGAEDFSTAWLLAVAAAVGISLRDLATRAVPPSIPTVLVTGWASVAVMLAGLVLSFANGSGLPEVRAVDTLLLPAVVLLTGAGIFTISAAMRLGDVAVVAPFRYTRLPFALAIGLILFGETVDAAMLFGTAVIVGSGLFIFFREAGAPTAP